MEKKSLSQQTAERLYTMIAVERRLARGGKLPGRWSWPRSWRSAATCRRPSMSWSPRTCWRAPPGQGDLRHPRRRQVEATAAFPTWTRSRGADLFRLREIFEPSYARLACRPGHPERDGEILAGEDVDRCIRQGGPDGGRPGVHAAIVRATHNAFMMRLLPHDQPGGGRRHHLRPAQGPAGGGHPRQDHALLMDFFRRETPRGQARHGHPHAPSAGRHGAQDD